jgi:uncharacterized coiled-coil protein SlyX
MTELIKLVTDGTLPIGFGVVVFLILVSLQIPKIINGLRGDRADGNILTRLATAEAKIMELSDTIHAHAIDITLAQMHLLKLYHQMLEEGSDIPQDVQGYVDEIMARRAKTWAEKHE